MVKRRVELEVGANIKPFKKTMMQAAKEWAKANPGMGKGGIFNPKQIAQYDRELRKVTKTANKLTREYEKAGRQINKMESKLGKFVDGKNFMGAARMRSSLGAALADQDALRASLTAAKGGKKTMMEVASEVAASKRQHATAAWMRGADPHGKFERFQQIRANPRMGIAGIAGAAAGALGGGGLSGTLTSVGAGMMMMPGLAKVGGAAAMTAGAALGVGKTAAKLGVKVGSWAVGQIMEGMAVVVENQMGAMALERTLGGKSGAHKGLLGAARRYGFQMGYTPAQAHQITQQGAMAGGYVLSKRDAMSNMAMMRGYSLNQNTVMGAHSTARHFGVNKVGDALNTSLIKSFKSTKYARPLANEFMQSLTRVMGDMKGNHGQVSMGKMGAFMGVVGQSMGGPFARSPQRTGSLLQQIGAGISGASGIKEGFNMAALGGGNLSYHQYMMRKSEGGSARNIRDQLQYADRMAGGDAKLMADYMHQMFGGNYASMFKLAQGYQKDPSKFGDKHLQSILGKQKADHFKQAGEASKRTGMWRTQEGIRQSKAAAAAKNSKNIKDVAAAYTAALDGSTTAIKKFGDALRGVISKMDGSGGNKLQQWENAASQWGRADEDLRQRTLKGMSSEDRNDFLNYLMSTRNYNVKRYRTGRIK